MDLHQALRVIQPDPDRGLDLAGTFHGWNTSRPIPPGAVSLALELDAGKWREFPVRPWAEVLLWVEHGLCLSNPDGEEPDVPAGFACVYRVRNRESAVFLVAGPEGCRGRLVLVPGRMSTLPPPFPESV